MPSAIRQLEHPLSTATNNTDLEWSMAAARAADDKLGENTLIIDVASVLGITGYFVITSGRNQHQVRAIADEIEEQLAMNNGPKPNRIEGRSEAQWLLMDYGDFVVHVFERSAREYYDLERLWSDQPLVPWAVSDARSDPR